ncbi:MAG: D-alanyl-D-alanine carboxypeptidase [Bacilli bacterium]|nr:D-alanyl-D-alanine carboxypeptidase [Bacilli bacterium]
MKRIWLFLLGMFFWIGMVSAEEVDLAPNSKSAILMSYDTGEVLYEKNAEEALPPASMTKIMSMLLIMEAIDGGRISWDDMVVVSDHASSMGGSQVFLQTGEKYSVRELVKGIAIASGNDAVVAMAEFVEGSEEAFVQKMNERALELGLEHSTFKNPHGLDMDGHQVSAKDMAVIARELISHEDILEFSSTYEDYLKKNDGSSVWLVNTNKLVRFYNGVDGLKTGYTSNAGYCLTATAKRENTRFITVVMGVENSNLRSSDTTNLLNYGFSNYVNKIVLSKESSLGKRKVEMGNKDYVDLVLTKDYTRLLKKQDSLPNYNYFLDKEVLVAPVKRGDIIAKLEVKNENGEVIDQLDVTVQEDIVELNFFEIWLKNINRFTIGKMFLK